VVFEQKNCYFCEIKIRGVGDTRAEMLWKGINFEKWKWASSAKEKWKINNLIQKSLNQVPPPICDIKFGIFSQIIRNFWLNLHLKQNKWKKIVPKKKLFTWITHKVLTFLVMFGYLNYFCDTQEMVEYNIVT